MRSPETPVQTLPAFPVLIHCESGYKALLERYEDVSDKACHPLTYWRRWSNIWVETSAPLG